MAMTMAEKVAVMNAHSRGGEIECRDNLGIDPWKETPDPGWRWKWFDYRVKVEDSAKKKTVDMWQYIIKTDLRGSMQLTKYFYADIGALNHLEGCKVVDKAKWSKIVVEIN